MKRIALSLLVAFALAGCTSNDSGASHSATDRGSTAIRSSATSPAPTAGCRTNYRSQVLPRWARAGFSESKPSVPYVLGDKGDIAAIVWVPHHPLAAPPVASKNNKILWVARSGAADGPLQIRAALEDTRQTVTRTVHPGPGPSVIDLPSPGCWSFDLTWGRHHDHLRLGYASG
jgi:hypothetical protein